MDKLKLLLFFGLLFAQPPGRKCWHDFTNADFHCWPLSASASNPATLTPCPGVTMAWILPPPEEIKAERAFNVSYILSLSPNFWTWAVEAERDIFSNVQPNSAASARSWCLTTRCPTDKSAVNADTCCIHHINVHSCPLTESSFCGPWIKPSGETYTHSEVLWGPGEEGHTQDIPVGDDGFFWESVVNGLYTEGVTQLIAHIKFGGMQMALFADVKVLPKTVCGDGLCEADPEDPDAEDCGTCPKDCGKCPLTRSEIAAIAVCISIVLIIILVVLVYIRWKQQKLLYDESWIVQPEDLKPVTHQANSMLLSNITSHVDLDGTIRKEQGSGIGMGSNKLANNATTQQLFTQTAMVNGRIVAVKDVARTQFQLTKAVRIQVKAARSLNHPNLCRFVGACVEPRQFCILSEHCAKGSLSDVLQNDDVPLNWGFRFSFAKDIVKGMGYLVDNGMHHGRLKTNNCVIDDRWTAKIVDYGVPFLRTPDPAAVKDVDEAEYRERQARVYLAPEVRKALTSPLTQPADVYAFGVILIELATRNDPYGDESPDSVPPDWSPPLPRLGEKGCEDDSTCPCPGQYLQLIMDCMATEPLSRPRFDAIRKTLNKINPNKKSPVDMMMTMMEKYSKHLESLVNDRTQDLIAEKQKTDKLLYSMLPRTVADKLKQGVVIEAEWYNACSIFFSDIVGFTSLSSQSTPIQIVALLNNLYTCFDSIIDRHDVYKVETIGDAYMVVSGVPNVNGDKHAVHIANMALELVHACKTFVIPHLPNDPLRIRVGLHSGPVCAGVVGLKMPRYCLFGDTVNTASRMESNGEAYKIHVSDSTHAILLQLGGFIMSPRGVVPIKGKGDMKTYWVRGHEGSTTDLLDGNTEAK